ncbi:tetratricopeptide repeat protein [bacterium]|nr:tetratricopeptide repeat protein [candidate division CSSED10-310 bacterium]
MRLKIAGVISTAAWILLLIGFAGGTFTAAASDADKLLARGLKAQKRGNYEEAQALLGDFLAVYPNHYQANIVMAQVLRAQDLLPEALEHANRARDILPSEPAAVEERILILQTLGSWQDSLQEIETLRAINPEAPRLDFYQALAANELDDTATAMEKIGTYVTANPEDYESLDLAAGIALRAGDYEKAENYLTTLQYKFPDNFRYVIRAGEVAFHQGQASTARAEFTRAIEMATARGVKPADKPSLALAHYFLGVLAAADTDDSGAARGFTEATTLFPLLSKAYIDYAAYLEKRGKLAEALEILQQSYNVNPRNPAVLRELGRLSGVQGDEKSSYQYYRQLVESVDAFETVDEYTDLVNLMLRFDDQRHAMELLDHAIEKFETSGVLYRMRGLLNQQKGALEKALEDYTTALAKNPKDARTYYNLGMLYEQKNSLEQAALYYEQAVSIDGSFTAALVQLAQIKNRLKDYEAARDLYAKVTSMRVDDPELLFSYANVVEELNQYDKAVALYNQALALKPDFLMAMNNLAIVHLKTGDSQQAETILKRIIDLNPEFKNAHRNLAYLYQQRGEVDKAKAELELIGELPTQ